MRASRIVVSVVVPIAVAIAASCRDATQVSIEAYTDVTDVRVTTTFTVGAPGEVEHADVTTEATEPVGAGGFIGSLTVVPRADEDGLLAVKLVMGVRRGSRDCAPPNYEGCIVARRRLRFVPHERLRLPIRLYARCEDVPCDADTTCNAFGLCVSAEVLPGSCESPEGCDVEGGTLPPGDDGGSPPDTPAPGDASQAPDGASASDASQPSDDSGASDASQPSDDSGASDASSSYDAGPKGHVVCGPSVCVAPEEGCCIASSDRIAPRVCATACTSPPNFAWAFCDGPEDCDPGQVCCADALLTTRCTTSASCLTTVLCHRDEDCEPGRTCTGDFAGMSACK